MKWPLKIDGLDHVKPLEILVGSSKFQSCIKIAKLAYLAGAWLFLGAHSVDKFTKMNKKAKKWEFGESFAIV